MRDLRLIGVHDDGEHLVVIDDASGEEYRLRIDEPLRAAARRDRPRLGQLQIAIDNDVRPREVQAMIRGGATAEEVSARTGWDLDKIARFEGPVLAEREHVAARAQVVRMRGAGPGDASETLADRVRARFSGRGVESSSVHWDARRNEEGQWTVSALFSAGGRERTATWWFDVAGMSVVAKNDEAKWLSEAEAPGGPVPSAVHRPTAVFDVEVEESRAERAHRADPDELIASMREHSGARGRGRGGRRRVRAADPSSVPEALPFDTAEHPPGARGRHPEDVAEEHSESGDPTAATTTAADGGGPADVTPGGDAPSDGAPRPADTASGTEPADAAATDEADTDATDPDTPDPDTPDPGVPDDDAGTGEPDVDPGAEPDSPDETEQAATRDGSDDAATPETTAENSPRPKPGRSRGRKTRASVPSWDDVMFGTTRD